MTIVFKEINPVCPSIREFVIFDTVSELKKLGNGRVVKVGKNYYPSVTPGFKAETIRLEPVRTMNTARRRILEYYGVI